MSELVNAWPEVTGLPLILGDVDTFQFTQTGAVEIETYLAVLWS